ncbi:MAG: Calx-beta domain-containing protein [bacterium]
MLAAIRPRSLSLHAAVHTSVALLLNLTMPSTASAQKSASAYLRRVREIATRDFGIPNPQGLTFSPSADALFVLAAANTTSAAAGAPKLAMIDALEDLAGSLDLASVPASPITMVFDNKLKRLLFYDVPSKHLIAIQTNAKGQPDPALMTRFEANELDLQNPVGMALDPNGGSLFILDQAPSQLVRIDPGPQSSMDGADALKKTRVSQIDLQHTGVLDLRGLAFNPADGHLYLVSPEHQTVYELTTAGQIVATRDLGAANVQLVKPEAMVFAPSGDLTDDPEDMSLYIVDNKPDHEGFGGSQIVELSFISPLETDYSAAAMLSARLVKMTQTSKWSPPSPDPMGAAYIPSSKRLMISDSEVDEMSIFKRVNVYETTLSGSVLSTAQTTSFSKEPTGVAFNPSNGHIFISDDDLAKVFEIDPGADGKYFSKDDVRTSFNTKGSKSIDAEGITFGNGYLYIADGVNSEIYEFRPGANGRFDGQKPAGDDQVSHFDTKALGIPDPETVEFNSTSGTLYITGYGSRKVIETTTSGELLDVIDIAFLKATNPSGMAYAPSSLNPAVMNLYIVARGVDNNSNRKENDGKLFEISIQYPLPTTSISIDDFSISEGDTGTVSAIFTLRLSESSKRIVSVDYATADSTAAAGSDYVSGSGTVSFPAGTTSQTITLIVKGDTVPEPNEIFLVHLSNPTNATIGDGQGLGTIINDEIAPASAISINDVTVTEGDSGTTDAVFNVTLDVPSEQTVTVDYATADSTATAGSDYVSGSGTLIFPAATTSRTIAVAVNGDVLAGSNETFTVRLINPANATIADSQGVGTIMNDDDASAVSISIDDVSITEGDAGTSNAIFNVKLSAQCEQTVTVDYATADSTATAGSDYVSRSGTVSFPAETTSQTIAVVVNGDVLVEANEIFLVHLSNPTNATIGDGHALGTIIEEAAAQIAHEETKTGGTSNSTMVMTSASVTAVSGHLYLVAISTRPTVTVNGVSGLGLSWSRVKAQCAGRNRTGIEVWMARGNPGASSAVTATLAAAPSSAAITVSRYSGAAVANPIGNMVSGNTNGINGACSGGTDNNSYSFNLTTTVNEAVVYGAITMRNRTHTPGAGYTERAKIRQDSGSNMASVAVQDKSVAAISTVAVNGSFSGTIDWAMVAVEIKPQAGRTGALTLSKEEQEPAAITPPPMAFQLDQNHPNPFNPSTRIRYSMPADSQVRLTIYDLEGRTIAVLVDGFQSAGIYTQIWGASDFKGRQLPNGVYFYRLQAGTHVATRKMTLLR